MRDGWPVGWMLGRRAGLGAWPAQRMALAAVVAALLLSAAWLGQIAPLLAQDGVGIAFDDLSSYPTETGVDRFDVQLTNLDADVAYQVVVSSDNAAAVGIGACGSARQTRSVTGATARDLRFFVHACAVAPVTVTAEVRAAGAATAAATVSRALTVLAFPEGAPVGVRGVPATRGPTGRSIGGRTHEERPGIVPSISFDNIRIDSVRANWGLPDDGGHELTGYGVLFWKKGTEQPGWGQADTIGVKRNHTFTGLEYDTTYKFRIHACHEDENKVPLCGFWTDPPREVRTAGPPDPPHTIKFTNITANSVRVTWSIAANTGGVPLTGIDLKYWPYDSQNPNSETGAKTHPADDGNDRGETLSGLTASTEYELKMRACNGTNDSHCSSWSADHRFTTGAPPGLPKPTAPPEQPTPPPVTRPGSGIATQMYRVGQLVSVVLPAASGGGHWTYTLSPALSNGLTFDPSSRTIAGTPQQVANDAQHTYTATKTENGATTIETSQFTVAVFDLKIGAQRRDDASYRRLTGPTFWGGVYEHWGVLHYAWLWILDVLPGGASRAGDYWFQLRLPASTGFQPSSYGECTWPAAGPSDTTQLKTAWTPSHRNVFLARCGFGSPSTANIELWVRDSAGHEARLDSRTVSGQAWHLRDNVLSYQVAGASGDSITAVASGPDALDGLFPPPEKDNSRFDGVLLELMNYGNAAAVWNGLRAGVSVGRVATTAGAVSDVVIRGYWDPNPGQEGDDGTCGDSIACMQVVGPNPPHMDNGRGLWIESKPHWGKEAEARSWTLDFDLADDRPGEFQYLPAVLVHELGHAIGLLHSAGASDLMNGAVRTDLSESDQSGARAIYGHHASH